tara:strand:+ start:2991 stop:5522 length:2532 start_codon:yes stop_codon:yes gene_type:complete
MVDNLNRSYMDTNYRKHRKKLLVDREISKTPELMHLVERTKLIDEKSEELNELINQYNEIRKTFYTLGRQLSDKRYDINRIKNGDLQVEKKKFIMPCPGENCKGYLSTQYKCEICKLFTCPDCFELIGYNKTDEHTCLDDNLKSAEMIKKETKGCPKCGVRIFKISGCFAADTSILMYDGNIKSAKDIDIGDQLIGDDGSVRNVTHLTTGYDKMYLVKQNNGADYIVNSEHTLVLYFAGQCSISYIKSIQQFKFIWFDTCDYKFKTKNFASEAESKLFKFELEKGLGLGLEKTINIPIKEYIGLSESRKKSLKGFRFDGNIDWEYKDIELDPYILGTWLGDGYSNGKEFCSNDSDIIEYWEQWALENDAEIVKSTNPYRYYVKNVQNVQGGEGGKKVFRFPNPLKEKLAKYNLINNKHIPKEYLINSKDIRLKVLAGIIDTDGCVQNNGRRITIITVLAELSKNIQFLAQSLGYNVNISVRKRKQEIICGENVRKDYKDQYNINISGKNINEIPTLLERKKCLPQCGGYNLLCTAIEVESVGFDHYYGWTVDNNHRFLLGDCTVAKNCDQMWCTECRVAFSWNTGKIDYKGAVHNPEFYRYMRENGGDGQNAPRNPGDVLCGGLINYYTFNSLVRYVTGLSSSASKYKDELNRLVYDNEFKDLISLTAILSSLHRTVTHITNVDLMGTRRKVNDLVNFDNLTVQYILNKKTREELATSIFRNDNLRKKYVELMNIYEFLSVIAIERFANLYQEFQIASKINDINCISEFIMRLINFIKEYNNLIKYANKQLVTISYTYNQSVSIINYDTVNYTYNFKSGKFKQSDLSKMEKIDKGSEASCSYH